MGTPLTARERDIVLNSYSGNSNSSGHKWIYHTHGKRFWEVRIHNEFRAKFNSEETAIKFRDMIVDEHPDYFRSKILEKYKDTRSNRTEGVRGPGRWSSISPVINYQPVLLTFN